MTPIKTPSKLPFPAYLMSFPFTIDNRYTNNPLMEPYSHTKYDYDRAFAQFMKLFNFFASESLIYLLPSEGNFQDQVYVANLGCYLPHLEDDTILLANFKSEPRQGEDEVGLDFFTMMGYNVVQPGSFTWEGEADLKYIRDNVYVGGYGIRSQRETYNWLSEMMNAEVVTIEMTDPKLYHFDCILLPLTQDKALVATTALKHNDLCKLEKLFDIISVPKSYIYDAWTNSIVFKGKVVHGLVNQESDEEFKKIISKTGLEPVILDLSEFEKSGAALSCMMMHFNYKGRNL